MRLEVCICTHNPARDVFDVCIRSLARQTLDKRDYRVTIIDNASTVPIDPGTLSVLMNHGVNSRVLDEPRLGNLFARITAIKTAQAEFITFIDDDIEVPPDFLESSLRVMADNPDVGVIGPRLLLPDHLRMPAWLHPFRTYLAIRDDENMGMQSITDFVVEKWAPAEPPSAGATVRKAAVTDFLAYEKSPLGPALGRKGKDRRGGIFSCEDALMFRAMHRRGFKCSYQPSLFAWHHLDPRRFSFAYCVRLLYGYGMSEPLVQHLTGYPAKPIDFQTMVKQCLKSLTKREKKPSLRRRLMRCAWWYGFYKRTTQIQADFIP